MQTLNLFYLYDIYISVVNLMIMKESTTFALHLKI